MRSIRRVLAGFDLEWNGQGPFALVILHGDLNGSIDIALQSVHWRPNMFLDIQKLVDAHSRLSAVPLANNSISSRL
jgi:hypothetical protein